MTEDEILSQRNNAVAIAEDTLDYLLAYGLDETSLYQNLKMITGNIKIRVVDGNYETYGLSNNQANLWKDIDIEIPSDLQDFLRSTSSGSPSDKSTSSEDDITESNSKYQILSSESWDESFGI